MYYYKLKVQKPYIIETSYDGQQIEYITDSVTLVHEKQLSNQEFYRLCETAIEEITKVWGNEGVKYKLISQLKKYGFIKFQVENEFTYQLSL